MHERQEIRDAVVAQLKAVTTDAGTRVFKSRMAPTNMVELPLISVYTDSESVDERSVLSAPRELRRTLNLVIEAWVLASDKDADKLDDDFDNLALQIETAMDSDLNLDGTAFTCVLTNTQMGVQLEGKRPMGCVHLEYAVAYNTDLRVDASEAAEFDTVHADVAAPPGQAEQDQTEWLQEDIQT